MTEPEDAEMSFQAHSDADLATILEAQLAKMRADLAPGRAKTIAVTAPVWRDEPFDIPTEEMSAAEIVDVRRDDRHLLKRSDEAPTIDRGVEVLPLSVHVVAEGSGTTWSPANPVPSLFGTPMMFSASEMEKLMGFRAPDADTPLTVEQQLINVLAEIEARKLVTSVRGSAEELSVQDAVRTVDPPGADPAEHNEDHSQPSFDDLLLGTASEE